MCQLLSVSVLALQSAAVIDLQFSINQLYIWLSDSSCFCRSVSLWIHANCVSFSLFVCFSVCLSVTVCQSACPPNCVSVLSASVLVTQSAVIDLQFYVNQFFCHQGKVSLYNCCLSDCSLFCRSVSPSICAKWMPVYSLYNYGSCLPLSFYQSVPTARVGLLFGCDSFTSWCLHFCVWSEMFWLSHTHGHCSNLQSFPFC